MDPLGMGHIGICALPRFEKVWKNIREAEGLHNEESLLFIVQTI